MGEDPSTKDEVREQTGCVTFGPTARNASNLGKPEKLVGEKMNEQIESAILEAARNAFKPALEKSVKAEEKLGEQDCGVLEAKVEGRVHLKIGGREVEGDVEATLRGTIKLTLPDTVK